MPEMIKPCFCLTPSAPGFLIWDPYLQALPLPSVLQFPQVNLSKAETQVSHLCENPLLAPHSLLEKVQLLLCVIKAPCFCFGLLSNLSPAGHPRLHTLHYMHSSPGGPPAACRRAFAHATSFVWNALPPLPSTRLELPKGTASAIPIPAGPLPRDGHRNRATRTRPKASLTSLGCS